MRSRAFVAVALTLVALFGSAGALLAYDASERNTIARGIKIGGIDVGGLSVAQAVGRVRSAYAARLSRPVVLRSGGGRFVLTPRAAHVSVDLEASVQEALARSREDNLFVRAFRSLTGGRIDVNIDPQLGFSSTAIQRLVGRIARALHRPAVDASISYSGDSIGRVSSQAGVDVRLTPLTDAIETALTDPAAGRVIAIPVTRTQPRHTTTELAAQYPTIITVDRASFTLRLCIHGTDELGSLGSAASHGCIRMAIPDVIELYGETPLGTPVYIV